MYNVSKPTLDDLPSSKQLLRSTLIALVAAIAILVGIVLPSEYAIDPTGIGRVLGLKEMGRSRRNWPKKPLRMPRRMRPSPLPQRQGTQAPPRLHKHRTPRRRRTAPLGAMKCASYSSPAKGRR